MMDEPLHGGSGRRLRPALGALLSLGLTVLLLPLPASAEEPHAHLIAGQTYGFDGEPPAGGPHHLQVAASDRDGAHGVAVYTPYLGVNAPVQPVTITLGCVAVSYDPEYEIVIGGVPFPSQPGHVVSASGTGSDGAPYYLSVFAPDPARMSPVPYVATARNHFGVQTSPGAGPCGSGPAAIRSPEVNLQVLSTGQSEPSGGGGSQVTVPGAPQRLTASSSRSKGAVKVSLAWQAPSTDGGSAITQYRIYRGTSPGFGAGSPLATVGGSTLSYDDPAVGRNTTYHYRVTAVNEKGEGPPSNEASATTPK